MSEYDPGEAAERIYGAVADDESLRGELDDTGYAPLVAWAAERADALTAEPIDDVDAVADRLRAAVGALVSASESGDPTPLADVPPDVIPPEELDKLRAALRDAPADPNERALALAGALGGTAPGGDQTDAGGGEQSESPA